MKQVIGDKILVIGSMVIIYALSPLIGYRYEVLVSTVFALLVVLSSRPAWTVKNCVKYAVYVSIMVLARHSLCCWQPWTFLFDHGLYESSALPLVIISVAASLSGWFLLDQWRIRVKYLLATLGVQLILFLLLMFDAYDPAGFSLPHFFVSKGEYPSIWEILQFEWMLTYYLVMVYCSRKEGKDE